MNRRELLTLALGLTVTNGYGAAQGSRNRPDHYALLRTKRDVETKSPGTYRIQINNRTLELGLPEPEPDLAAIPATVASKGEGKAFEEALYRLGTTIPCFLAGWKYGVLDGALLGNSEGWISIHLNALGNTYYTVEGPEIIIGGVVWKGRKEVKLDYAILDDFVLALQPVGARHLPWPHTVEQINGRRWVRMSYWHPRGSNYDRPPPRYTERWYTPTEQGQYLVVTAELRMPMDYVLTDLPSWAQRASRNITAVLRSIKLSRPDDGSPDPFLLDLDMKPEAEPVTFPGKWQ
jgi:hypothetical protein